MKKQTIELMNKRIHTLNSSISYYNNIMVEFRELRNEPITTKPNSPRRGLTSDQQDTYDYITECNDWDSNFRCILEMYPMINIIPNRDMEIIEEQLVKFAKELTRFEKIIEDCFWDAKDDDVEYDDDETQDDYQATLDRTYELEQDILLLKKIIKIEEK